MDRLPAKAALRAMLRARRRDLARRLPHAAEDAAAHLPVDRLPAFAAFAGYHPTGSELDPGPLVRRLAETGAVLALPTALDREQPLVFRLWDPADVLAPDAFGVPCPPTAAPVLKPDLVIAPVLGFDRQGRRLGQGGGTYDRTLANLRAMGGVFVLGLAYCGQEVDEIPSEPHDQRLDAVLTEAGYRQFGG
jgi:5-formyltetrahydrofolate cyclo-ligase